MMHRAPIMGGECAGTGSKSGRLRSGSQPPLAVEGGRLQHLRRCCYRVWTAGVALCLSYGKDTGLPISLTLR